MVDDTPKLTCEVATALAEYVFNNPGKSKLQLIDALKGSISRIELGMAEDFLSDSGLISYSWELVDKDGKKVWGYVCMPDKDRSLDSVKNYIKSSFDRTV